MSSALDHELRRHATALRSLARALVGDSDAEDLLQETALQALRSPPRTPGPLGGWLAGIVRHLASRHRRSARRRQRRELAAARDEIVWPDRSVDDRDTLRALTEAVLALPEPYRDTVLQRYLRDLPPSAIAAQSGVPVQTVKSRLKRGLALLREHFAARGVGDDWRLALGSAFGLGAAETTAAVAVTGVLLMSTAMKVALSGAAALLALATWWIWGNAAPPEQVPVAAAPATAPSPASAEVGAHTPLPSERREVAALSPGAPTSDLAMVRGRCVDESGRPLPRCEVELRTAKTGEDGKVDRARAYGQWLIAHPDGGWRNLQTATGADGRFEFVFTAPPLHYELRLRRDVLDHHRALGVIATFEPRDVGDIVLPVTCHITGRVVDTEGARVANAKVTLRQQTPSGTSDRASTTAETRADGSFETCVLAGQYTADVAFRAVVRGDRVEVAPALAQLDIEIVIAAVTAADTITGTVVDLQGAAVAAATVQAINQNGSMAVTDANGRFCLCRPRGKGESVLLFVGKDGRNGKSRSCTWGTHDLHLVLDAQPGISIELQVTTTDGAPVTDFAVRSFPPAMIYNMVATPPDGPHDDGIARLIDVPPTLRFVLVEPHRWDLWNSGFVALPTNRDTDARMVITLPAAAERTLRVQHRDGTPGAGAAVELLDPEFAPPSLSATGETLREINDPDYKGYGTGYQQRVLQLQRGITDANGELQLHGPAGRMLALRLPGPGHAPMLVEAIDLDARSPLLVTLPQSGRLDGRLTPDALVRELRRAGRLPADGPATAEHPGTSNFGFRLRRGRGPDAELVPPASQPAVLPAGDGSFAIDGVPPGTWELTLAHWDGSYVVLAELETVATVEVRADHTTAVAVDLPDWLPATFTAQVLSNGKPFGQQAVTIRLDAGGRLVAKELGTDADGRFELHIRQVTLHLATTQLVQRGKMVSFEMLEAREQVFVQAGQRTSQVFHLDSGKLRLRVLDAEGRAIAGLGLYLRSDSGLLHKTCDSDADGRISLDVEPGTFTLSAMPLRLRALDLALFANSWTVAAPDPLAVNLLVVGSVTAKIGETVEAEVHLPAGWNR